MAYSITDKPNTEAPSGDYPFGNIRDKQVSIGGTPVNKLVYADFHQFFAKLMDYAGVTPNGLPDNDYSGWQLMEALLNSCTKKFVAEFTSEGDGNVITITRAQIENAFNLGNNPLSKAFPINSVGVNPSVVDLKIDVYAFEASTSNKWDRLEFVSFGGSGNTIQINGFGDIEITLDSFTVSPAIDIRVVIQG